MTFTIWYLTVGVLLVVMALAGSVLKRLPLTASMFYLAAGLAMGQVGAGLLNVDPLRDAVLLERITEVAVIISLFTAGLKLRLPVTDSQWRVAVALAGAEPRTMTLRAVDGPARVLRLGFERRGDDVVVS